MIARDSADPSMRYMFPVKSSLAADGEPIGFRIDEEHGFTWLGKCEMVNTVMTNDAPVSKIGMARSYILDAISDGPVPAKDIINGLSKFGIGLRTVESAKKELDVKSYRIGSAWYWALEDSDLQERGIE